MTDSSSSNSKSSSEEDETSEVTEDELDTPMRKKSREHPGSVLRMLTQHVQEQLEQTAAMELPEGNQSLTNGINIHIFYPASQTCLSSSPEGTPQAPSLGEHHGRAQTGRSGKSRRRTRSQIHGDSSKSLGFRGASRKAYGTIPPRRIWSSKQQHDTCNEKTYSIGGEDARELYIQTAVGMEAFAVVVQGIVATGWQSEKGHKGDGKGKDGKGKGKKGKHEGKGKGNQNEWQDSIKEKPEEKAS